jgi:ribokinase
MNIGFSSSPQVAVLGAAATDWVARVKELPRVDGIVYADDYTALPGGTGGNVAEGIAHLGHKVRFLGELGDDISGQMLLKAFKDAGVDTQGIRIRKDKRTASCFVAINEHGDKIIVSLGGIALYQRPDEVNATWLTGVEVLVIADAFPEVAERTISYLQSSAKVIFNPGGLMASYGDEFLEPFFKRANVLIASKVEAEAMTGTANMEKAIVDLSKRGPQVVMITMGHLGSLTLAQGNLIKTDAFPVVEVLDSTGAGDAFTSGIVSGMLEGLSWEKAARLGCAVASMKVTRHGARGGLPNRWQVQDLLDAYES